MPNRDDVNARKPVRAWEENVVIPTYRTSAPDPNPMFFEKRVNQGSSGRVYPNPIVECVTDDKIDRTYRAVLMENEYLQLMILPEIGGRLHAARDKTNGYDFIYRQHVIKPGLIGLLGPWVSGGLEFNWPLHHKPSTYMPASSRIVEEADGSRVVWLGEYEPMERIKGMVGIRLHPGKAYIETETRLYNRTPYPQPFLWWHNLGVHVNDRYQVVFPPDVTSVVYHARRDSTSFPVARGTYSGIDFGEGADISWYENTPFSTSFFAHGSRMDFFGGYDHGREAGLIHVGNHHITPGKKFFTWGKSEVGEGWCRLLTDADGPYIELMAGSYSNNQPDFSWLMPYETKNFKQYWYPVQKIGPAKIANLRAAANVESAAAGVKLGIGVTESLPGASVSLASAGKILWQRRCDLEPGAPLVAEAELPEGIPGDEIELSLYDAGGLELLRYKPEKPRDTSLPEPSHEPPAPEAVATVEELYLIGLHLEQNLHPTWSPEPYWEEALRRDPDESRIHTALGRLRLRRGKFEEAEKHFRRAIARLTALNPNPYDGEPYYQLGLALKYQGRRDEAYDAFYKCIWNQAWQAAGYYALAQIDCTHGDWMNALEHLDRSLSCSAENLQARALKSAVLRRLGRSEEAEELIRATLDMDCLDYRALFEAIMLLGDTREAEEQSRDFGHLVRGAQEYLDVALDYADAGMWEEAQTAVSMAAENADGKTAQYPMLYYARAFFANRQGDPDGAREFRRRAAALPTDYCFPARLEEMLILEDALASDDRDAKAHYYLGNLYYDKKRREEAIEQWETACELEPGFAIPRRNLGIAYHNMHKDVSKAREYYQRACSANPRDPRLLFEFDLLLREEGAPPDERLAGLEANRELVDAYEPLVLELAALYNQTGAPAKALALMEERSFHPWEGGQSPLVQYAEARLILGRDLLEKGAYAQALEQFEAALDPPLHVSVGRTQRMPAPHLWYYSGLAREAMGDPSGARECFDKAAGSKPSFFAGTYHQALALMRLGREAEGRAELRKLLDDSVKRGEEEVKSGYMVAYDAEIGPFTINLKQRNRAHCAYLAGLALLGLGRADEAAASFRQALSLSPGYSRATEELKRLDNSGRTE